MTHHTAMRHDTRRPVTGPGLSVARRQSLRQELRGVTWLGIALALVFFAIGGGWAATAPLSSAVIAAGFISPEGRRQTVQHLEGGIIHEIRVRDGDRVAQGQVLLVLGDVSARAEVGALMSRLRTLAATEARLTAEGEDAPAVSFTHQALEDRDDPEVHAAITHQTNLFATRKASIESQQSILRQRVAQLKQQIAGTQKQLDSARRRRELIQEEIVTVDDLVRKGFERKPRLLDLQSSEVELLGDEGELIAAIARSQEEIGETQLRIANLGLARMEGIAKDLAMIQEQRIEVEKQVKNSLDRLNRTEIAAPVAGIVLNLKFHSLGGVIRSGEPILDIVPADDDLIVEARVSPRDIDDVNVGLATYVTFPSYTQRNMLRIPGQVSQVSADALTDERSGEPYFLTKIQVDRTLLRERAPEIKLTPGLPAESYIATGDRTVLQYLTQPIRQTFERALREH